jgi:hypothetical protein
LIKSLKSVGYNPIRLPKADVKPLQILGKFGKDLDKLGELSTVMKTSENIPLPQIKYDTQAANITGERSRDIKTADIKVGIGLALLGGIISAMGGSNLGLAVKYQQSKTIAFEYNDVLEDKVEVAALEKYLARTDIDPDSVYISKLFEADKISVITSTIKSNKIKVIAKTSSNTLVQFDVPVIQGIVGSNIKVSSEAKDSSQLTFEGKIPLVFAFQALQIFYDNGAYTAFKPVEQTAMKDLNEIYGYDNVEPLITDQPFTSLS